MRWYVFTALRYEQTIAVDGMVEAWLKKYGWCEIHGSIPTCRAARAESMEV